MPKHRVNPLCPRNRCRIIENPLSDCSYFNHITYLLQFSCYSKWAVDHQTLVTHIIRPQTCGKGYPTVQSNQHAIIIALCPAKQSSVIHWVFKPNHKDGGSNLCHRIVIAPLEIVFKGRKVGLINHRTQPRPDTGHRQGAPGRLAALMRHVQ